MSTSNEAEFALQVQGLEHVAEGVLAVTLGRTDGGQLPTWEPGAHIDLVLGADLTRQYSLCGDPEDTERWTVAVLRDQNGRGGSSFIHSEVRVGDRMAVRGPRSHFKLVEAQDYFFVAGGIGITPLLPMLRALSGMGHWRLLYGGRTLASMAFVEAIEALGGTVLLRPQDRHGLLDLDEFLSSVTANSAVYCCGPEPLVRAVEERSASWPSGNLHVERFRPRQSSPQAEIPFVVELGRSRRAFDVPADQTIAEVLEAGGVRLSTVCREGTCGNCETRVLAGIPDHRDSVLTDVERASGLTMMVCCSRSRGPRLVLDL